MAAVIICSDFGAQKNLLDHGNSKFTVEKPNRHIVVKSSVIEQIKAM